MLRSFYMAQIKIQTETKKENTPNEWCIKWKKHNSATYRCLSYNKNSNPQDVRDIITFFTIR
jgi:hypothetical protein